MNGDRQKQPTREKFAVADKFKGVKIWVGSMADWKGDRKRSRDEYDVRGGEPVWELSEHSYALFLVYIAHSRPKRGRYSDPGPRGREHESTEEMLDSLIVRAGEKV